MKTLRCSARAIAAAGYAVLTFSSPARGQDCPEHAVELHVGIWGPTPTRIEVSGLHVSLGSNRVIIDASDPEETV
jgi:hypothetical protein